MKHIIASRFYCMKLNPYIDIFDKNILEYGYKNLCRWLIPSLNNQLDTDFIYVLLIHKDADNLLKEKLIALQNICNFPIDVIILDDFCSYINNAINDRLIISRTDIDDSLHQTIVKDIKEKLSISLKSIAFYGYNFGYEQDINNPYKLKKFNTKYIDGSFSAMQSIIISNKIDFHPYMWNHTNVRRFLKQNNINDFDFSINNTDRMFIRNYTGINGEYFGKKDYDPGIIEDISEEIIHKEFGV